MRRVILTLFLLSTAACAAPYHPDGYADPSAHGPDLMLQVSDCRACHGDNLDGDGSAEVSCDTCHRSDWRENCTFCHGGLESDSGAPPRELDGATSEEGSRFPAHTAHTTETNHPVYECRQCHLQPNHVLSESHLFDDSPGQAEVDFSRGIARETTWDGAGCSDSSCHGDGRAGGDVDLGDGPLSCDGCHVGPSASIFEALNLSGEHAQHVAENVQCEACHPNVSEGGEITDPMSHVDGEVTIEMPEGISRDENGRCTGPCHYEGHNNERW